MVNGKISLAWGDGDHDFNIAKIGQIFELQDKCGCGLMEIFNRLRENRWRFEDIRETIRLGLIGGGKSPVDALVLTKRYVDDRPLAENTLAAMTILQAAIVGVPEEEQPEKKKPGRIGTRHHRRQRPAYPIRHLRHRRWPRLATLGDPRRYPLRAISLHRRLQRRKRCRGAARGADLRRVRRPHLPPFRNREHSEALNGERTRVSRCA